MLNQLNQLMHCRTEDVDRLMSVGRQIVLREAGYLLASEQIQGQVSRREAFYGPKGTVVVFTPGLKIVLANCRRD